MILKVVQGLLYTTFYYGSESIEALVSDDRIVKNRMFVLYIINDFCYT